MSIVLIIVLSVIPGGLLVYLFSRQRDRLTLEFVLAALVLGIGLSGWLALVLAEINRYSLPNFLLIWFVLIIALGGFVIRKKRKSKNLDLDESLTASDKAKSSKTFDWMEITLLILWLIGASWLYFRPHEYIMGGADAGVYVSLGAEIAQHGGFQIENELLASIDPELKQVILRPLPTNPAAPSYYFPGFYMLDEDSGRIAPQFYPLHPVWQAIVFSLTSTIVAGVRAELLVSGLWMMLAALSIFFLIRELVGKLMAFIILFALTITALEVWFGRYPTTEALTQFLFWAGFWGMALWLGGRRPAPLWAFITGVTLGSVFLVRIDVLIVLPIFILFLGYLWLRGWEKSDYWFAVPFLLLTAQSIAHGAILSTPYFTETVGFGLRLLWANWWILAAALLVIIFALFIARKYQGQLAGLKRFRRPAALLLISAVLIYAIYGWFFRPYLGTAKFFADPYSETILTLTNHENWIRLGWYLSPVGIWLGVVGCCFLIWRLEKRTAVLLLVGLLFSATYLWNVRANPHHVYVMRRYVPVVVPFFMVSTAVFLGPLFSQRQLKQTGSSRSFAYGSVIAGLVLMLVWLAGLGWSARGFISQVDHSGVVTQLGDINESLHPESILIFNDQAPVGLGDFWGTPLKFIFGHDVFILRNLEDLNNETLAEMIDEWQYNDRSVVWIGNPQWLDERGFPYRETAGVITSQRLEGSYEKKPQAIIPVTWTLDMALIGER